MSLPRTGVHAVAGVFCDIIIIKANTKVLAGGQERGKYNNSYEKEQTLN